MTEENTKQDFVDRAILCWKGLGLLAAISLMACSSGQYFKEVTLDDQSIGYEVWCPPQNYNMCNKHSRLACPKGYSIVKQDTEIEHGSQKYGSNPQDGARTQIIRCGKLAGNR